MAVNEAGVPLIGAPTNFEELEHAFASLQSWLGALYTNFEIYRLSQLRLGQTVAGLRSIVSGTLLQAPTGLTAGDEGALYYVTDFAHLVRWTGTVWAFADGGNKFFADFAVAPGTGWALCNGASVSYMTVGATLGTAAFATLDLVGSPAYKKSGGTYAGITAASGSTGTGTTGTGTTGTGTTGTGTSGTESAGDTLNYVSVAFDTTRTVAAGSSAGDHTHSVPGLSVPGLSVPGLSVPALGVGSLDMAHATMLPYFRL